jgi:hypothetical protein
MCLTFEHFHFEKRFVQFRYMLDNHFDRVTNWKTLFILYFPFELHTKSWSIGTVWMGIGWIGTLSDPTSDNGYKPIRFDCADINVRSKSVERIYISLGSYFELSIDP